MSTIKYKNPTTGDWSEAVVDVRMEEPTLVPLSVNQNGGYIKPSNGIATASTERTNMRVIERINDHVVKVVLK